MGRLVEILGDMNSALVKSPALWKALLLTLVLTMALRTLLSFRRRRQQVGRR